jgi:hypothetical protein
MACNTWGFCKGSNYRGIEKERLIFAADVTAVKDRRGCGLLRSIATASAARPTVPAATATAGHRDNLARFVSRLHNGCPIGRAGKRA